MNSAMENIGLKYYITSVFGYQTFEKLNSFIQLVSTVIYFVVQKLTILIILKLN